MVSLKNTSSNMIANNLSPENPVHPGEIIKDEMEFLGITQKKLSEATGISYTIINEIVKGKRQVSIEYALLFEATLNLNAEMLVNMQLNYNKDLLIHNSQFMERLKKVQNLTASVTL